MLPVYLETHDANRAWEIGAAAVVWTGIIKLAAAPFAGVFRRFIPAPAAMTVFGAAMYSYLALVLLQRVFDQPLVGLIALAIIFTSVLANIPITRWRIPPFIAAWIVPLAVALGIGYVRPTWSGLLVPASLRRHARTTARHDAGASVSFRDRAHRDLSSAAGHRFGGGSRGRRRRL